MSGIILDSMVRIPAGMLTADQEAAVTQALTLRTPDGSRFGFGGSTQIECYAYENGFLCVPRNWPPIQRLLSQRGFEDLRSEGHPITARFGGIPRKGQKPFVEKLRQTFLGEDALGAIGQAGVGFGKTLTSVMLACELGRTTLFVAHKEELCKQFEKAVKLFTGEDCGWIRSDGCDYKGRSFCVAMIQSLYQRDYPSDFYNYFGLVVYDEAHMVGAETFAQAASKMNSAWRLGLTATPRRGDRLENVFHWHIGDVAAVGKGDHLDCSVYRVVWDPNLSPNDYTFRGKPSLARAISKLANDGARTAMIVGLMSEAVRKGRKLLVLSHRVKHLEEIKRRLEREFLDDPAVTVGYYCTGGTKKAKAQRELAKDCTITVATLAMASQGLDIPDKDTLFLTTPMGDPEQACGRIRRLYEGKKDPMVIEIVDQISFLNPMHRKRHRYYSSPGLDKKEWPVKQILRFAS
jgi:superfamily II DNA or RNA helicase